MSWPRRGETAVIPDVPLEIPPSALGISPAALRDWQGGFREAQCPHAEPTPAWILAWLMRLQRHSTGLCAGDKPHVWLHLQAGVSQEAYSTSLS